MKEYPLLFPARLGLALLGLTLALTGCAPGSAPSSSAPEAEPGSEPVSAPQEAQETPETDTARAFTVTVNGVTFTGTLCDNPTAEAFAELLPMTLSMDEFAGNEKFHYLSDPLPADRYRPDRIHTGDVKLYLDNCIVLFFDDFPAEYDYTDIGTLDSPENLAEVLGSGTVEVTFALPEDEQPD